MELSLPHIKGAGVSSGTNQGWPGTAGACECTVCTRKGPEDVHVGQEAVAVGTPLILALKEGEAL